MNHSSIIDSAAALARQAHAGQTRKDGAPYIVHPERVARLLAESGFDDLTVAAGWLHDTLEDTPVTAAELAAIHPELPEIVGAVTEDGSLPWVERKRGFADRLRHATDRSRAVAWADRVDNLTDFLEDYESVGPDIWKRWPERTPEQKLAADRYFLDMLAETLPAGPMARLSALVEREACRLAGVQ